MGIRPIEFIPVSYTHLSFPTFYMFVIAYLPRWLSLTTRAVSYTHLDVYKRQVYGPVGSADNGRFGNRLPYFFGGDYANASWGIPEFCWEYPRCV